MGITFHLTTNTQNILIHTSLPNLPSVEFCLLIWLILFIFAKSYETMYEPPVITVDDFFSNAIGLQFLIIFFFLAFNCTFELLKAHFFFHLHGIYGQINSMVDISVVIFVFGFQSNSVHYVCDRSYH